MIEAKEQTTKVACAHCGEDCNDEIIHFDQKEFCCTGCKTVYEILSDNDLCDYYDIDTPNITVRTTEFGNKYAFLDNEEIEAKLYQFSDENYRIVKLFAPVIHCASCIWLLENLARLLPGVSSAKVNFVKKEVTISFKRDEVSLRKVVETMASIGYPPDINLQGYKEDTKKKRSRELLIKMGVAGFCFGNIMLMSFPEYLSFKFQDEAFYIEVFAWLNLILSLPIVFYSATEYFISAYKGLKHRTVNLDVPISLGISVLFIRSSYEIITGYGPGYLDSLAGLVFFLLIGKWFQNRTYQALSFERDYKSYFPLGVTLIEGETERSILASQLKKGDEIFVRNEELIPGDSILVGDKALIDYSFVTGESKIIEKKKGDFLYAGGRLKGNATSMIVQKEVSQSYLTDLWNQQVFQKEENNSYSSIIDRVSQYFTTIIVAISIVTGGYWYFLDPSLALETFTAVLIIACPCALALSLPFTMGNAMRFFGRVGFYVKNAEAIESMSDIDTVVFDKTGTLTSSTESTAIFIGARRMDQDQLAMVAALTSNSTHPISQTIYANSNNILKVEVESLEETPGQGISGIINRKKVKIGSASYIGTDEQVSGVHAFVEVDGKLLGYFLIKKANRKGLASLMQKLKDLDLDLHLISGDNSTDQTDFYELFPNKDQVIFNQSPQNKLDYIQQLQSHGKRVMMIGDGLNDAGAIKTANVGLAISEDVYSFSPACDAIMDAHQFGNFERYLKFSKQSMQIVRWSFLLSFLYNLVGLFFAVQGKLTPVVAAILMPLSSISIVAFVTIATNVVGGKVFWRK